MDRLWEFRQNVGADGIPHRLARLLLLRSRSHPLGNSSEGPEEKRVASFGAGRKRQKEKIEQTKGTRTLSFPWDFWIYARLGQREKAGFRLAAVSTQNKAS